ncbi:hypothetical protein [Sutcliffiella rhizosphaerae]|uniref:Uncharacterized protein n=1 Tax=Sutcliffiella rhizosphaerae TaxID=2880967 RepID=A0ABN8A9Z6_9BACI|nr:hypothetical protein [Sutcliffiella rhizosphaerae]CAG9622014.1 hypothetical protein BACCIP111883_02805 [Sutcliffiella rhizosphaerae]
MYLPRPFNRPQIGTAWHGTHIIIIRCNFQDNSVISIFKSPHAPLEPISTECTETLSRFLSIGYTLIGAIPLNAKEIQYVLQYR